MSDNQIQEYANNVSKTRDTKYNTGREHCIKGYTWTDEAKYFILVENLKIKG